LGANTVKKYIEVLFSLLLFLIASLSNAQTEELNSKISRVENNLLEEAQIVFADSVVKSYNIYDRMKYYKVPSVSIAVINNGKLEWAKAYGLADVSEKREADINTVYQAASLSKPINALCIMKLVQDGKLSLTKDIREYLKSWTFPDNDLSKGKPITIKNLLSHTAGLSLHGFRGYLHGEKIPAINDILDGNAPANNEAVKPIYIPGIQMEYSGGGTLITRKIIEDNIAANYDSLMKAVVLAPLSMSNSSFIEPLQADNKNFAAAYNEKMQEIPGKYNIYPELAPDGLWTTPSDFSKFIIAVQQSLEKKSGSFLSGASAVEMLTPVEGFPFAALGVFIMERGGDKYFSHSGANNGFRSIFYGSFTTGSGIVIMVNSDNEQIMHEIANSVAVVYNWKGFYNPEERELANISDSLASIYAGTYVSKEPEVKITVAKKNGALHLTTKGEDNLERMLFLNSSKFYLPSSPNTFAEFINNANGTPDTLLVQENNKILIKAVKSSTFADKKK
jgi:CubicO group peptidase (beta-lactamase class C family)